MSKPFDEALARKVISSQSRTISRTLKENKRLRVMLRELTNVMRDMERQIRLHPDIQKFTTTGEQ